MPADATPDGRKAFRFRVPRGAPRQMKTSPPEEDRDHDEELVRVRTVDRLSHLDKDTQRKLPHGMAELIVFPLDPKDLSKGFGLRGSSCCSRARDVHDPQRVNGEPKLSLDREIAVGGTLPDLFVLRMNNWSDEQVILTDWLNERRRRHGRLELVVWDDTGFRIPWELLWLPPNSADGESAGNRLGAVATVTRWLSLRPSADAPGRVKTWLNSVPYQARGGVVYYIAAGMKHDETLFSRSMVEPATSMRDLFTKLRTRAPSSELAMVYVACHGEFSGNADDCVLGGFPLGLTTELNHDLIRVSERDTFVFLNGCNTGSIAMDRLDKGTYNDGALRGFAKFFLLSGAAGVLATTGAVRNDDAGYLARDLLACLKEHPELSVADAVRQLRANAAAEMTWDLFLDHPSPDAREQANEKLHRRHLVAVNLALVTEDRKPAPWPLATEEECVYTCALDGGADFDLWAVDDAAVVLHRFGGSYGPAEFVVTPKDKPGSRSIWLTIINQWGVPIGEHELRVEVRAAEGEARPAEMDGTEPRKREDLVEAGTATGTWDRPEADLRVPGAEQDGAVRSGSPAADVTGTDLPGTTRPDRSGVTSPDFAYPDPLHAFTDDLLAGLGFPADIAPYTGPAAPIEPDEELDPRWLAEWYNVVGLRRSPSGRLHLGLLPLFAPGTPPGERVPFTVRCGQAEEHGTVFAVVAELPNGERRRRQLRSVQSVRVLPGVYQVTAELLYPRPGHVRFHGLPTMPRDDLRRWPEIMATVPRRLADGAGPAHLIAAIEVSGSPGLVSERIDCVRLLVGHVADQADVPVSCSVITYGPHSINVHNHDYPEVPVTALAWADTSDVVIDTLARLARRPAVTGGYAAAAQIECVLAELDGRLTGSEGRPVIVTAGSRPAHPPTVDASRIIPCVYRNDWRYYIDRLARHAGIAYGAIHDNGFPDALWRFLGNDIGTAIDDFSAPEFALALGLTARYAQSLPLPLIDGLQAEENLA